MVNISIKDYFPKFYPVKSHDIEVKNGPSIPSYYLMKEFE